LASFLVEKTAKPSSNQVAHEREGDLEYSTKLSQEENDLEVSNSLSIRSTFLGEKNFLRENGIK
jgi:hypothetical protein